MKILSFTSLYPNNIWPHHGIFVKERVTRLARLPESDLKVVAPVPYFPKLKINSRWRYAQVRNKEEIEGLDVFHPRYFFVPKIAMLAHGYFMALSLIPFIRKLAKEFEFDVIDSHYAYPDGFAAVLLGRIFKRPVVITTRGSDINLFANLRTIRPLLSRCMRQADQMISVSQALKDAIAKLNIPADKVHVIPNGVDTTKFHRISSTEARKSLGLPLDKKIILSVGGLVELKGFDILVRSLRIVRDSRQDILLVIVGDGEERHRLEHLITRLGLTSLVRLAGDIPHAELFRWYSAADLCCLASKREGMPNVILESFACGTPVVASEIGGIPEIITSDHVGMLCERNDRAFAETILKAITKTWSHDQIIQHVSERTWDRVARSVFDVLNRAVSRHEIRTEPQNGIPDRRLSKDSKAHANSPHP